MPRRSWEHFVHGADIGVRGRGDSLETAFEQAALAVTGVVVDTHSVVPERPVAVECEAPDHELLLVDWLNALIFEMATRKMLFSRFEVHISGERLEGRLWGEAIQLERHRPAVEVKGATYTELRVGQESDGRWFAQCVVDV